MKRNRNNCVQYTRVHPTQQILKVVTDKFFSEGNIPIRKTFFSFSEDPIKLRQTGRQSGRFRKSSSGLAEPQRVSVQRPKSSLSPSGTGAMMNSLIVDSMTRPTTPHHPPQTGSIPDGQPSDQRKKSSTISRTESYRRARGTEDDRPKIVKQNDTYNSLTHQQGTNLRRGNSEDSLRNALDREQRSGQMPRSKSRQEKKGECSVM